MKDKPAGAGLALSLRSVGLRLPGLDDRPIASDISFDLAPGKVTALIGESGAGKTSLALAIMGLWPGPVTGHIVFDGQELAAAADWRRRRGRQLVLMMQDPTASLNPALTIGAQLAELLRARRGLARRAAKSESIAWLGRVGLEPPAAISRAYVHQLSGGMAQRAALAMALACEPQIMIADEPFSALDPDTAGDQIELLRLWREQLGFSLLLITHDLRLARDLADDAVVLKDGSVVEAGRAATVFCRPGHEYTAALLAAAGLVQEEEVKA